MSPVEPAHPASAMRLSGLDGRVAVVTGSSSGIGRCVAETLDALGCRVAGIDLAAESSAAHASFAGDVSDEGDVERCFSQIEREVGSPELLVRCAGIFQEAPIAELCADRWRQTLEVNLTGTFLCASRALPSMRERRFGRIVTLSSGAGIDGGAEACAHYAASKGGVIAFTKALSKEVAREGVTANVVRDDDPVVFMEHKRLYLLEAELDGAPAELGRCRVARHGRDVTIVSVMKGVVDALAAAEVLAAEDGIDAEVIDLRAMRPLDLEGVVESVGRTSRVVCVEEGPRTGGWAAGLIGQLAVEALETLDDAFILSTPDHPVPFSPPLEDAALPGPERIREAVRLRLGTA